MKHILNNLSEQEKNAIREQHTGGMKLSNEKFSKLISSRLGDVRTLVKEEDRSSGNGSVGVKLICDSENYDLKKYFSKTVLI